MTAPAPVPTTPTSLVDLLLSQVGETATISVDPDYGNHVVVVEGSVDVAALAALALDYAADIVRGHYVPNTEPTPLRRPTPAELALEFKRRAEELRC